MAKTEKVDNMIRCVNKENGKIKFLPASLFTDKDVAERLDWKPLEGKKFEDNPIPNMEDLRAEREAKAERMKNELAEKKRLYELEQGAQEIKIAEPEVVEEVADPLGDQRHHSIIIKEIKASTDATFVSKYLSDNRKSVRESAEEKLATF
jgi:hypothetical protein